MKKIKTNGGDMEFLGMIILFIVIVFIIWVLTGGPNSEESKKPFITAGDDQNAPLQVYGPGEKPIRVE